jgi:hypothetical protein
LKKVFSQIEFKMETLEKKDESVVKDIDKTVKNKFRFAWLGKRGPYL